MNILMIITLLIGLVYACLALKSISSFPSTFKVSICVWTHRAVCLCYPECCGVACSHRWAVTQELGFLTHPVSDEQCFIRMWVKL